MELDFSAIISTTIQVVSSRSPFDCTAVCKRFQMCKEEDQVKFREREREREVGGVTLTICSAAGSGGSSREQLKDTSGDRASQTPSLAIISRPPAVDSYTY